MSAKDIFNGCEFLRKSYKLPNDNEVDLRELSARERGQLRSVLESIDDDPICGQARIVIMGCDDFNDADLDALQDLPGTLLSDMANIVLDLSRLGEEDEADSKKD